MKTMAAKEPFGLKLPSVSVCLPAYNEEATIAEVLGEVHALLAPSGLDYEILVCNDGSADRTLDIIRAVAAATPRLRVLDHPKNLGIRETFEDLYAAASKDFVFLNSTDRQWQTEILFGMLPMTTDWDIIIASRLEKHYGLRRAVVSGLFNLLPRLLFGVTTYDAGAVKLVKREIIERFPLVSKSPFNEAERIIRAIRAGYRVTARPVEVSKRHAGREGGVSTSLVLEAVKDLGRVWWALRREEAHRAAARAADNSASTI